MQEDVETAHRFADGSGIYLISKDRRICVMERSRPAPAQLSEADKWLNFATALERTFSQFWPQLAHAALEDFEVYCSASNVSENSSAPTERQ
jgi:hypothetical protein